MAVSSFILGNLYTTDIGSLLPWGAGRGYSTYSANYTDEAKLTDYKNTLTLGLGLGGSKYIGLWRLEADAAEDANQYALNGLGVPQRNQKRPVYSYTMTGLDEKGNDLGTTKISVRDADDLAKISYDMGSSFTADLAGFSKNYRTAWGLGGSGGGGGAVAFTGRANGAYARGADMGDEGANFGSGCERELGDTTPEGACVVAATSLGDITAYAGVGYKGFADQSTEIVGGGSLVPGDTFGPISGVWDATGDGYIIEDTFGVYVRFTRSF